MRTMKKLIPAVLAAILLLTACGGEEAVSLNMDNLANRLMQEITYEDTISETTPEMAQMLYGYADGQVVNCKVIISAGATTEEIAILNVLTIRRLRMLRPAPRRVLRHRK